jgi:molybdenum cofactor synthesis domain-containing protein
MNNRAIKKGKDATIINIGDELLRGDIADTNSSWLAKRLFTQGVAVKKIMVVGDDEGEISEAVKNSKSDFVFVIGGLGPTHDDVTREGVAKGVGEGIASSFRDDNAIMAEEWILTDKPEHEILDVLNEAVRTFTDVTIGSYPYMAGNERTYKVRIKLVSRDTEAIKRAKKWLEESL